MHPRHIHRTGRWHEYVRRAYDTVDMYGTVHTVVCLHREILQGRNTRREFPNCEISVLDGGGT